MDRATTDDAIEPEGVRARLDRHGLVVEDAAGGECLRFDAGGGYLAWHRGSVVVRRSLFHDAIIRHAGRPACASREESSAFAVAAAARAGRLRRALEAGCEVTLADGTTKAELSNALACAAAWDLARHDAARAEASRVHPEGIPILPPHRRRDVVVEPARGCPNARCSFCAFYRGRRFQVLGDADFDAHLEGVVRLAGSSLAARDGVFLGSGSAASLPDALLLARLARLDAVLGRRRRGVATFLDPDHARRREVGDWARLVGAGLCDLTAGLETGDPVLRRESGKRDDIDGFVEVVRRAKAGGARLAISVLVGLGGAIAADRHREASTTALERMTLDARDLIYLSPLAGSLSPEREASEIRAWRAALAGVTAARAVPYGADTFAPMA